MDQIFFTTVIFSTCFFFLSVGVLISGKPIQGSCGRRSSDPNDPVGELDCLCEKTGNPDACSGITEEELIGAMQRAKQVGSEVSELSSSLEEKL
jgi:hypothetical protein